MPMHRERGYDECTATKMEDEQHAAARVTADATAAKERVRVQIKSANKDMMDDMHKKIKIIESKPPGVEQEHFLNGTRKTRISFQVPVRAIHCCIAECQMFTPLCLDTFL